MAAKKARKTVGTWVLYFALIICIFGIKKRTFVSNDIIGLYFNLDADICKESFVFSSLYAVTERKCRHLHRQRNLIMLLLLLSGDVETCPGPSRSLTREEFKQTLSNKGIKMVHQNIRGLQNNFDELQEFISSLNEIDIISLSETHLLDEDPNESLFELQGYTFIERNRSTGIGGGVSVYIRENVKFKRRTDLELGALENIWIEIFVKNSKSFLFGCFYRPPESSKHLPKEFNTLFDENITKINEERKEVIIMGDFNVNYENNQTHGEFKSMMTQNGFKQIVKSATRITKDTSTLIDLIFTNRPSTVPTVSVVSTSLSDHDMVGCTRKINFQKYPHRTIKCRNYVNYNHEKLIKDARNIDWQPIYDNNNDVNTAVKYLIVKLKELFDFHAPIVEKRVKGKPSEWLDESIKTEMNRRDALLRRARKSKNINFWREYKKQRNKCTGKIKKARASFHQRMLNDTRLSPRKFWNTIKTIFPNKGKAKSPSSSDIQSRVSKFGKYFSTVTMILKSNVIRLTNSAWRYTQNQGFKTNKVFKFSYISTVFVEKELRLLRRNKATGLDKLPPNMLKDCATVIAKPLAHILNLSIQTQTVPTAWKSAKVSPIFKSGDAELVENYRPISVLPVLSKILEKAVHHQFYSFLENNKLLSDCQFGFRKQRSTKLASILFCDTVRKEMDNGNLTGCVYLDLSKAFDTIGHNILLDKLSMYGVLGSELAWFTDYLFNRNQLIEIQNICSSPNTITSGVPQGSILGPLMFIVFFNDLKDKLKNSDIIKYADDTVILFAHKDVQKIEKALNEDMELIGRYCDDNELFLNLKKGKTEVMLFGTAQRLKRHGKDLNIMFNNAPIIFVTEYVYLGNIIDNHMILAKNFDRSYKKASGRLRLLRYVRPNLTAKSAEAIYNMMILPILTYGSTIKTTINDSQLEKYASLERRARKIIGKSIPSTKQLIEKEISLLVRNCLQKKFGHETFDNYFQLMQHDKRTRNNNISIRLPPVKLEAAKRSFFFGGAKLFNSLPESNRKSLLQPV